MCLRTGGAEIHVLGLERAGPSASGAPARFQRNPPASRTNMLSIPPWAGRRPSRIFWLSATGTYSGPSDSVDWEGEGVKAKLGREGGQEVGRLFSSVVQAPPRPRPQAASHTELDPRLVVGHGRQDGAGAGRASEEKGKGGETRASRAGKRASLGLVPRHIPSMLQRQRRC